MFKFYIRKLLLLGETDPHSNLSDWMQHLYICEEISWTLSRKIARQTAFSLLIVHKVQESIKDSRKLLGGVQAVRVYLHNPSALLGVLSEWVFFCACLVFEIQNNNRDYFIGRRDAFNKPDWHTPTHSGTLRKSQAHSDTLTHTPIIAFDVNLRSFLMAMTFSRHHV